MIEKPPHGSGEITESSPSDDPKKVSEHQRGGITRRGFVFGGLAALAGAAGWLAANKQGEVPSREIPEGEMLIPIESDPVPVLFREIAKEQYQPKSEYEFEATITEGESLLISYFLAKDRASDAERQAVLAIALEKIAAGLKAMPESYAQFSHAAYCQKYNLRFIVDEMQGGLFAQEAMPAPSYDTLVKSMPAHLGFSLTDPSQDPMEERAYKLLFYDEEYIDPAWIVKVTQAVRVSDELRLRELGGERPIKDPYPGEDSTEIFAQLLSGYATERAGNGQVANVVKHLGHSIQGKTWAEVGFGSGKVFSAVRKEIGDGPTIYGVEIGEGQQDYVKRISGTLEPGWKKLEVIDGTFADSKLPTNSVDIIHMAGVHLSGADNNEVTYRTQTLPWLESMRMALKSGGVVVMQDAGEPGFETVDKIMREAGFELDRLQKGLRTPAGNEDFTVSYKVSSKSPKQVGARN